ncbi:MAG: cytochrome c3 family protein [Candidatus Lloydbacteria bacterium]|nr:cytochrome c3 family protein [Candidatus Lloydbacteria bacterium]
MLKKVVLFILACVVPVMFTGSNASAGIVGSDHDLSTLIPSLENICFVCHTPHKAKNIPDTPLSSRNAPTGPYTLYSSPTLNAVVEQPGGTDLLCLSCHDGTIALDTYQDNAGGTVFMPADHIIGLSNSHPISFNFINAAALDPGIANPIDASGSGLAPFKLFNGYMRCATCHDPHKGESPDFLRNASPTMCTVCHINK